MNTALAVIERPAVQLCELRAIDEERRDFLAGSMAQRTIDAYASDWRHFVQWCESHGLVPLPATSNTVSLYLAALAETHKPATLAQHVSAISSAHNAAGHDTPTHAMLVQKTLAGIRRAKGTAPDAKAPLTVDDLRSALRGNASDGLKGLRDHALLLVGFAGAFRRSELVGIDVERLEFVAEGVVVTLPRSKTDQEGAGRKIAIPLGNDAETCPVRALTAWLGAAGIESGPVFRSVNRHGHVGASRLTGQVVALIVKQYMAAIGKDTSTFAGHSLRAGFATAAARAGAHERDIMRQTGHKSTAMVRRYIRDGDLWRSNAATALGL